MKDVSVALGIGSLCVKCPRFQCSLRYHKFTLREASYSIEALVSIIAMSYYCHRLPVHATSCFIAAFGCSLCVKLFISV